MNKNYEQLYLDLKNDNDVNLEIIKELEGEVKELADLSERLKSDNARLFNENAILTQDKSKLSRDLADYKEKNIDKMKDLDFLNIQYDKLKKEIEKMKEERSQLDKKIVHLENDNDYYLKKLREVDVLIEELNNKLNSTLEENISLQTDYDNYKQSMEETLQRKEEDLEEAKNEILSKDKAINRLTTNRDFVLRTLYSAQDDINNDVKGLNQFQSLRNKSTGALKVITPVNKNKKIPEKFLQSYSKSFMKIDVSDEANTQKKEEDSVERKNYLDDKSFIKIQSKDEFNIADPKFKNYAEDLKNFGRTSFIENQDNEMNTTLGKGEGASTENIFRMPGGKKLSAQFVKMFKENKGSIIEQGDNMNINTNIHMEGEADEEREFLEKKLQMEVQNILDEKRNYIIRTMTFENFSFDILGSTCLNRSIIDVEQKQNPARKKVNTNTNSNSGMKGNVIKSNIKLAENIDEILLKIQQRKEKVINQKKIMQSKLEKIGMKVF